MSELDLVRRFAPETASPAPWARASARGRLLARARGREQARSRRRLLVPTVALTAALAVLAGATQLDPGGETASAAPALRRAAEVARTHELPAAAPGRVVYTRSETAYTVTSVLSPDVWFTVLVPRVREIWLGAGGGRLVERPDRLRFLSERDRKAWIAAGRPALGEPRSRTALPPAPPLALPSDPDRLYAVLEQRARGHSEGTHAQMFTLIGDALREPNATAPQRAALYEVAARLPGVELVGEVTDPAGRPGVAVAYTTDADDIRHTLVFDPATSALLAEEQLATGGSEYAEGTRIGYAVYLDQAVVDAVGERP